MMRAVVIPDETTPANQLSCDDCDEDGWQKPPRDMRDEALADLRQQLADARASEARAWARVRLLESRLDDIRGALVKR